MTDTRFNMIGDPFSDQLQPHGTPQHAVRTYLAELIDDYQSCQTRFLVRRFELLSEFVYQLGRRYYELHGATPLNDGGGVVFAEIVQGPIDNLQSFFRQGMLAARHAQETRSSRGPRM